MRNSVLELDSLGNALSEERFPLAYDEEQQLELNLRTGYREEKAALYFWNLAGKAVQVHDFWVQNLSTIKSIQAVPGFGFGDMGEADLLFKASQETARIPIVDFVVSIARSSHPSNELLSSGFRNNELKWRRNNRQALQAFAGQWVVLEGEEIIAHGHDLLHVDAEARARGTRIPYLFYVEGAGEDVVPMGL